MPNKLPVVKEYLNSKFFLSIGYGWLTIHLINAYYHGDENKSVSSIHVQPQCKPYVKLYVNETLVMRSQIRNQKNLPHADVSFETAKISKNSTITLHIWDAGCGLWSKKEFVFRTYGTIDSFLSEPIRENKRIFDWKLTKIEAIETMSFWLDEYK